MKKKRSISIIYYLVGFCFYIAAILNFANHNSSLAVVMMCLGSFQLCLGSVWLIKNRKPEKAAKRY